MVSMAISNVQRLMCSFTGRICLGLEDHSAWHTKSRSARNSSLSKTAFPRGSISSTMSSSNRSKSWLGQPVVSCQSKVPVFNQISSMVPFICPCEDDYSTATQPEHRADLPVQGAGLFLLAIPDGIKANSPNKTGRSSLKLCNLAKYSLESLFRFQVDIETNKVQECNRKDSVDG